MGRRWRCLWAVAGLVTLAWAWAPRAAEGAAVAFKCATATVNDIHHEWCKRFTARLEKRTDGRMKGQVFPAGQLGPIPRLIEGVQLGTIEAFMTPPEFFVGIDPRFQVLSAPFLFADMDHAYRVITDKEVREKFLALAEDKGLKGVNLALVTPSSFVARNPIRTPDDLRGKKVRVLATPMETGMIAALGGTGVPMPWGEVLPALQQGAVDAVQAGVTVFVPFKYYDVAKYHTNTNHYLVTGFGTVSKRWYDGLPADLQRAVVEEAMAEQASLHEWTKNLYTEGVRVWKERTKDGWIELTEEQRAAFRQRLEGVDGKVAAQIPLLKEWLDLLRAKSKQYAR